MTSAHNKHQHARRGNQSEQGVTLLLAVLILASMVTIVFSVAAIAFNETKTSGDVTRSEPAITAAEAGAEDSLYYTERGVTPAQVSSDCASPTVTTLPNGVKLSACTNAFYPNPYTFPVTANAERDFYLYNPTNNSANPGYTGVTVILNSGFNTTIHLCTWADIDCANSPDIATATISAGGSWNTGPLSTSSKYQLFVLNGPLSSNITVNSTPLALPAGTATVETTGANGGTTRKLQTVVP